MRRHLIGLLCLGAILFLAGVAVGLLIQGWAEIDTCLDRGGSWDYKLETCVYR